MAPGAARDLAEFGRRQPAILPAIKFTIAGESNVIDIEIESHANGIGGDDIIHVAILINLHLRIARPR